MGLRKWLAGRHASVEVSEMNGVRSLHLGGDAIQSSMRLSSPDQLELHYTRAMLGALLFHPAPQDMLMIGLGGGSIPRFVHKRMDAVRMTAVEINPRVVTVARSYFGLPEDDERLSVVVEDGLVYLPAHPMSADIVLLDAFEDGEAVSALCSQKAYDACYAALRDGGVFVQNFMADEEKFGTYLRRIERAFEGRVLCMPAGDRVNMIVFGLKVDARRIAIENLKKAAGRLERRYALGFPKMVKDILATNECTASYVRLVSLEGA
jgi:spermidine synthase